MHAGQAKADGDGADRRVRDAGLRERLGDRVADGFPGVVDAVREAGRAALALRQFDAVGAGKPYAGAGSAAVDADEVFDHMCCGL